MRKNGDRRHWLIGSYAISLTSTLSRPSSKFLIGPLPSAPLNTRLHHRENKSRSNLIKDSALANSLDPTHINIQTIQKTGVDERDLKLRSGRRYSTFLVSMQLSRFIKPFAGHMDWCSGPPNVRSRVSMISSDSVMKLPSILIAGRRPLGTSFKNAAGLSP